MNYITKNKYHQINFEERVKIEYLLNECSESISKIAKILIVQKNQSNISSVEQAIIV